MATAGATHWWSVNRAKRVFLRMSPLSRSAQSVYMNLMVSLRMSLPGGSDTGSGKGKHKLKKKKKEEEDKIVISKAANTD